MTALGNSGYPCDLYDRELYPDWRRVTRATFADGVRPRTECLWLNPAATDALGGQTTLTFPTEEENPCIK